MAIQKALSSVQANNEIWSVYHICSESTINPDIITL